jgi:hypothetical protein
MKRAAAVLLCSWVLSGCTYTVRQIGDDRFLSAPLDWQLGETSLQDVVAAFGPPDVIRWSFGRLFFVYRAKRQVATSFVLSFYLKVISNEYGRQEDATLIVAFDDRDRVVYYGASEHPREDLAGDLGLRR